MVHLFLFIILVIFTFNGFFGTQNKPCIAKYLAGPSHLLLFIFGVIHSKDKGLWTKKGYKRIPLDSFFGLLSQEPNPGFLEQILPKAFDYAS